MEHLPKACHHCNAKTCVMEMNVTNGDIVTVQTVFICSEYPELDRTWAHQHSQWNYISHESVDVSKFSEITSQSTNSHMNLLRISKKVIKHKIEIEPKCIVPALSPISSSDTESGSQR